MSTDEMEFETPSDEIMQADDNTEHTEEEYQKSTQQALKQLNQLTGSNGTANKIVVPLATTSHVTVAKIRKPETKLVYIKNSNGVATPLHIPVPSQSGGASKPVHLVQLPKTNIAGTTPSNTRIVLKSNPKFILAQPGNKTANTITAAGTSTSTARPISVSQAQQIGLHLQVPKTVTVTQASTASTSTGTKAILLPSTSSNASATLKNPPTILNKGVKSIHSSNIVTLAGTNQQVRKVTVPGKGVQIVRVVNSIAANSSGNATTTTKIVNGRQHQVFVQRKLPSHSTQIIGATKSQFITKKLGLFCELFIVLPKSCLKDFVLIFLGSQK